MAGGPQFSFCNITIPATGSEQERGMAPHGHHITKHSSQEPKRQILVRGTQQCPAQSSAQRWTAKGEQCLSHSLQPDPKFLCSIRAKEGRAGWECRLGPCREGSLPAGKLFGAQKEQSNSCQLPGVDTAPCAEKRPHFCQ